MGSPTTGENDAIGGFLSSPTGARSTVYEQGSSLLHGWLLEAREEGDRINHADPSFDKMDTAQNYIMGEQITGDHPSYLHKVVVNQCKKAIKTHVSALTDVAPLFGWKTQNPNYQDHGGVLDKLTVIWWINTFADLALADVLRYALIGGSGDCVVEYDPYFIDGGNTRLIARDPRDTLPLRPTRSLSLQDWEGVTIREAVSPNKLKYLFPEKSHFLTEDSGVLGGIFTKFRRLSNVTSATTYTLDGLRGKNPNATPAKTVTPEITLYRTFLHDRSINQTGKPMLMGRAGTNWSYMADPMKALYPNGRLIVWTERTILFDGPSPYWHGYFPISRLKIDPWPWSFFGLSILNDLMPGQDILNTTINDFLQVFSQWVNRGSVWDSKIPEGLFRRFDPRKPNWKVKRPNAFSEGMKPVEGPQLPAWAMQFLTFMFQKFDDIAGTANIQALLQLRQAPGADTIEKFMEALTPEIRLEGRQIEVFLRDVAMMFKGNVFQFESKQRRFATLGESGGLAEDLDYDPDTLIPAMAKGEPGYIPDLDASLPRHQRARFFMHQFAFRVAPNSMLAMEAQTRKLLYLQLSRQGYLDFWTLMEILGIPNVGQPPPMPLPVMGKDYKIDPDNPQPPPLVLRVPTTITERLMAMQQMGIGQTVSPVGRKASGQSGPTLKQKSDGSTTVAES